MHVELYSVDSLSGHGNTIEFLLKSDTVESAEFALIHLAMSEGATKLNKGTLTRIASR